MTIASASTTCGIGDRVAIPHARIQGFEKPYGISLASESQPSSMTIDDQPVDIVFFLLLSATAEAEQLNTLACIARRSRDGDALREIRAAVDGTALYQTIVT